MHTLLSEYIQKLLGTMKTFVLLTDKTADETITVTFGCVLPVMLAVLFISMTGYCVHRYIHVSKQKHPTNLVSVLCCRCHCQPWHSQQSCAFSVAPSQLG